MVLLTGANTRLLQLAAIDEQIELCRQELAALVAGVDAELAECRGELHGILGAVYEALRDDEKSLADTIISIFREEDILKKAIEDDADERTLDFIEERIANLYDSKRRKVRPMPPARVEEINDAAFRKFRRG